MLLGCFAFRTMEALAGDLVKLGVIEQVFTFESCHLDIRVKFVSMCHVYPYE